MKRPIFNVAWLSQEFATKFALETPYRQSPELVIEIMSPSNSKEEMREKRELYFSKGAREVWICQEDGSIKFYSYSGEISNSEMISEFPNSL